MDAQTYFLLDSRQGKNPLDGWRARRRPSDNLQITLQGLSLAQAPSPPVPLKDTQGTFGGLQYPTGVAVDKEGAIYIADGEQNLIYKVVRREGLQHWAYYFRISGGTFAGDRFVYISTAHRLERWQRSIRKTPQNFAEVEVICETVWSLSQARKLIESLINQESIAINNTSCCLGNSSTTGLLATKALIEKEWEDIYPDLLPSGEACKTTIEYLPCLGGLGSEPRQFNQPNGLAISAIGDLYVADTKNHRVQVFALHGLVLKAIWGKFGTALGEFNQPWDVVVDSHGNAYIADKGNHRLQKFDKHARTFSEINGTVLNAHIFQVLYGSSIGDRFVFIPARRRLEYWLHTLGRDPQTPDEINILSNEVSTVDAARQLVLEFIAAKGATDILVEYSRAYPTSLLTQPEPAFDSPTHLAIDNYEQLYVVDETKDYVKILNIHGHVLGRVSAVSDVAGFPPTAIAIDKQGRLILSNSTGIYRYDLEAEGRYDGCCVHKLGHCTAMVVDANGKLFTIHEPGVVAETSLTVKFEKKGLYISNFIDSNIYRCQWHKILVKFASPIPTNTSFRVWTYTWEDFLTPTEIDNLEDKDWQTGQLNAKDFLILSPPGRYLWIKIELESNELATPLLQNLKVYFPRQSYLQYLPAVYQADPVSKNFLERFLSIFETIFSGIEGAIDHISRYFDPDAVPKEFLLWLAAWVDMFFDPSWSLETKRQLLRQAPELYRQRGTPAGLKLMLRLALGIEVQILEHFQLRRWLFLAQQSSLGENSQLWGNSILHRLQLEENSRIGDFALIGTKDPLRDPFHVYAHKFSVFIPATYTISELAERKLRYLIDQEKPAHTEYTLCKVEPRFRVGVQSTVGLDTQVGVYPRLVLNYCSTLGYDTLLSGANHIHKLNQL